MYKYSASQKRPTILFIHNVAKMLADFKIYFTFGFNKEFTIKSLLFSTPHFNYVSMLHALGPVAARTSEADQNKVYAKIHRRLCALIKLTHYFAGSSWEM